MRFDRVQAILEGSDLKEMLGPKDQEIQKKTGEKHLYSRGVVLVTMTLHERGFDAHNVDRHVVQALAAKLLPSKAAVKLPVAKPAKPVKKIEPKKPKVRIIRKTGVKSPGVPRPGRSKLAPRRPAKGAASAPAPVAAPKPPETPKPAPTPVPQVEAPTGTVPVIVTPVPTPTQAANGPVAVASETESSSAVVFYVYGTALSMAISLAKTLEVGDRLPGAEQRQQAANDMIEMLFPLRDQPVPLPKDLMPAVISNVKASASAKS